LHGKKWKRNKMKQMIAVGGKGGVGKTLIVALLTQLLSTDYNLLTIDADPALGLAHAIGIKPDKTIWDIRESLKEGPERKKLLGGDKDRPLKKVIKENIILKTRNFDFLVMGRSEGPGCYCALNDLLRYSIDSLAQSYDMVLVDCEAGLEQVNRRVLRKMDTLLLITDPTLRGVETIRYLFDIACKQEAEYVPQRMGLIFNRVRNKDDLKIFKEKLNIKIWGYIPDDELIKKYDLEGRSLLELPDTSPAFQAAAGLKTCLLSET